MQDNFLISLHIRPEGCAFVSFIQPLRDLQEVDGRIRELEQEILDIPERKKQEGARLNSLKKELEIAHNQVTAVQSRIDAAELESQSCREKINDLKKNQAVLKTNKEFQMYNREIKKIEEDIANFDARELAAMDDLIPAKAKSAEIEGRLHREQAVVDEFITELDQRLVEVEQVLEETRKERAEVAKSVDSRKMLYYERLRAKRWPVVVELVDGTVCSGCNLVQPPSVAQMVRRDQGVVVCTMCGRILYMD